MTRMHEGLALELLGLIAVLAVLRLPPELVIVAVPALLPSCNAPDISMDPPEASVALAMLRVRPPLMRLMTPPELTFNRLPPPDTVAAPTPGARMTNPGAFTLSIPPRRSPEAE